MKWKEKVLKKLVADLQHDEKWLDYAEKLRNEHSPVAVHLAIFSEGLLEKLLAGYKTFESRFSSNKISPFNQIESGDIVLVKKSGGPIVGVFITGSVKSYSKLTPQKVDELKEKFSEALGLEKNDSFWQDKANAKYATLVRVKDVKEISPYTIDKKDRTGWVVIKPRDQGLLFNS